MSTNAKRQLYDIALNGQGFILSPNPEQPHLIGKQNEIFSQRIANGDKSYNDFIAWWYMAQTDWAKGFKDVVMFGDSNSDSDSYYYYSSNIDTLSEPGAFKLALAPTLLQNLGNSQPINTGAEGFVNALGAQVVGTSKGTGTKGIVWLNIGGVWTDISSATFTTGVSDISQLVFRLNYLWSLNVSSNTYVVGYWNATSWVDATANINSTSAAGGSISAAPCGLASNNGSMYIFVTNVLNNRWSLVKSAVANPTLNGDWTRVVNFDTSPNFPVSCAEYLGKIYYLMNNLELRVYDPVAATDTSITTFIGSYLNVNSSVGIPNLLKVANNLLHIALTPNEVWTYNGSSFNRLYFRDIQKRTLDNATADLTLGLVAVSTNLYSGNLIIANVGNSTENLYNWIKNFTDTTAVAFRPIFSDSNGNIYGTDSANVGKLYEITAGGSTYKSTAGTNYIVYNNFDLISGIDKLAYSVNFVFKTLIAGHTITWEYLLGELTNTSTWTTLGTASFATDGAITSKTLYFGKNVLFKKIWFRAKLDTTVTSTPVVYDGPIFAYLPMPDYKMHWEFTVKCQNKISRKDQSSETKDALWLRNFLQNAWMTKSVLTFEDYDSMVVDYIADNPLTASATTINMVSTDNFPEIGRLLIESEEIFYTGKTKTSFLNCVRGSRSSLAVSHVSGTAVTMSRNVIIRDYTESLIIANDPLNTEYRVSLAIQEV